MCIYIYIYINRPYGKFLSVKMVVFFTFWQGMILSSLTRCGAFGFLAHGQGEADLVKEVISNFLICFEMMVASWYHYQVFPSHDYLLVLAHLRYSGTDVDSPASLGRLYLSLSLSLYIYIYVYIYTYMYMYM